MKTPARVIRGLVSGLALVWLVGATLVVRADEVDDYVTSQMREQNIPGLSLAVVREGRAVRARGYGLANVELNAPASAETVYRLASVTKPLTAAAVMLLVQDGKLRLDDKVNRYLKNAPPDWRDVTIWHLLTNSSGIKDHLNEMNVVTKDGTTPEEIAAGVGRMPLNFAPGTQVRYSNTGFLLLRIVVEKVSGKSYEAFLKERIFNPLGMSRTRLNSPDELIPGRASGYVRAESGLRNSPYFPPTLYDNADAGLVSTVQDLARWDAALYGDALLNEQSRAQMWMLARLADGTTHEYGFGWLVGEVNGHRLVYCNGNRPDTSTFIGRYLDDKLTVIVLTNLSGADPSRIARHVAGLYVPALMPTRSAAIADAEPSVTALVRAVLLRMQDGTIDSMPFTAEMWKGLYPGVTDHLRGLLASSGPLKSLELLAREAKDGRRRYRYRAVFGYRSLLIDCTLTAEDKISEMGIGPE